MENELLSQKVDTIVINFTQCDRRLVAVRRGDGALNSHPTR